MHPRSITLWFGKVLPFALQGPNRTIGLVDLHRNRAEHPRGVGTMPKVKRRFKVSMLTMHWFQRRASHRFSGSRSFTVLGGLGKNHVYFLRMRGEMESSTVARKEAGYRHCVNTSPVQKVRRRRAEKSAGKAPEAYNGCSQCRGSCPRARQRESSIVLR